MGMHRVSWVGAAVAALVLVGSFAAPAQAGRISVAGAGQAPGSAAGGSAAAGAATSGRTGATTTSLPAARRAPLTGTSWRAVLIRTPAGRSLWVRRSIAPRMRFTASRVYGFAGCNYYNYRAVRSPRRGLKIGGGLITTQGCSPSMNATELAFGEALPAVRRYVRHDRTLSLLSARGATLIVLRRIVS